MKRGINMGMPNEKLEAARMHRRWSVALASEKVGVSINTFNRWERGLQLPQLGMLDQLCKAFALSPDDLGFGAAVMAKRQPSTPSQSSISPGSEHRSMLTNQASCATPSLLATMTLPDSSGSLFTESRSSQQLSFSVAHSCFEQARRSLADMHQLWHNNNSEETKDVSRRHALAALLCAPAAVFGLTSDGQSTVLHPAETLSLCATAIPLSWRLFFEGGMLDVERLLPGYLLQLDALMQRSMPHREQVASLASQGYQLASLIALQHQNFGMALAYAHQAFAHAKQINDPHLQTSSLIRKAQVYFYLQRPRQRLQAYEQALQYSNDASPLLRGRVYIGLTETYSHLGREEESLHFLSLAHQIFPTYCETDPSFSYTHFNRWSLTSFEGQMYLNLKQFKRAWELFERIDKIVPKTLVPNRVELAVRQAAASSGLDDIEQSCSYVEAALHACVKAGNQLRHNEVYTIYEAMCNKWKGESRINNLGVAFS